VAIAAWTGTPETLRNDASRLLSILEVGLDYMSDLYLTAAARQQIRI
jgi:hypothetical protein